MMQAIYRYIVVFSGFLIFSGEVFSQGSIFGTLQNTDLSMPAGSAVRFFGFIDNTDNEIRLHSSIGAGYDSGNWYDDFQNYLGEAPGLEYHYFFFNLGNSQAEILNKLIPDNSYQREDVILSPASWPDPPAGLSARRVSDDAIRLDWRSYPSVAWHIYRRDAGSQGSFFRLDKPQGNRMDQGVIDTFFVDTMAYAGDSFSYVVITEAGDGSYSPPSNPVVALTASCCQDRTGNIDLSPDGIVDIGDLTLLIYHLFIAVSPLECPEAGNVDGDPEGIIDIGDVSALINSLYITLAPTALCP